MKSLDKPEAAPARLRGWVFWPPFIFTIAAVVLSIASQEWFAKVTVLANDVLIASFGWLFNLGALCFLGVCLYVLFSRHGSIRIGGPDAQPELSKWQWFSINLCTTVAIGILFWGTAEPIYHLSAPPVSLGLTPNSAQAALYSLSTMLMHWTIVPYAIYSLPALAFALAYYNLGKSFSIGAPLTVLIPKRVSQGTQHRFVDLIDAMSLYSLILGMSASLGTGILTVAGGLEFLAGIQSTPTIWVVVGLFIVGAFILSASTGLKRGIVFLSSWNTRIFFFLVLFVFVFGPTVYILNAGTEALGSFLSHFFERSLMTGATASDSWPRSWTMFYWANWLAWAPITAVFLGRIAVGQTVRMFLIMNLIIPALFGGVWMCVFSGTTIHMELFDKAGLAGILNSKGPESIIYEMFARLPISIVTIPLFIGTAVLSYVSGA
ncbi:MAG: BCCT family transporter, partial [Proteobacteria bacterium]|nr:BCCT family transporter [Pseudomonadota bacterium]